MSGDAVLNRDTLTEGVAKTTLIDGVKQIDLNKITEGDIGLMLGVILSHEAMRDGVEGTEQEQAMETFRSVLTHSIVGGMVQGIYGKGSLSADVIADIKALQTGDMDAFARYALGKFDSEGDNWKLMEDGSLRPDGHLNIYKDGSQNSEDSRAEDGLELGFREMEDLLKTSTVDEEGFIDIGNGNKVKAEDLKIAVDANKLIEQDLKLRSRLTSGELPSGFEDPFYNRRIESELKALEDGHVSYGEASALRAGVNTSGMGISLFEHWNMREVLNKSWEFQDISNENKIAIKDGGEILGENWIRLKDKKAVYHSFDGTGRDIIKLVSESGREVVFNIDTNRNPLNPIFDSNLQGTYNYGEGGSHVDMDVLPYWKWGNNAMATTPLSRRIHPILDNEFKPVFYGMNDLSQYDF